MTQECQITEISPTALPEFIEFYQHFPDKYPFVLNTSSRKISQSKQTLLKKTPFKKMSFKKTKSFDILFIKPDYYLTMDSDFRLLCSDKRLNINIDDTFLDVFDTLFAAEQSSLNNDQSLPSSLPFLGGWFIFLAYELARQLEPKAQLKSTSQDQSVLPVACAARVKQALIYDHQKEKVFFISEAELDHDIVYQLLLDDIQQMHNAPLESRKKANWNMKLEEEDDSLFLNSAEKVHHYIKEGDVFQVNLSRMWKGILLNESHSKQAFSLAQQLNKKNPAPFSGLAGFNSAAGRSTIISSSPERLLKVKNGVLESRPIAGTRPRSSSDAEDIRLLDELHAHPKEQAEHIMLIDLIRNDLGRVCIPGSVIVDELMTNESYAHVHHIVSNVIGKLRTDTTPGDVIKALFPGGTITGCPKVRCMEIIAELEQDARGAYTGSMGYINRDGSMDLNILIRTMLLEEELPEQQGAADNKQQTVSFRAGAGLVFDSIVHKELEETRAKAKGLLRTLQELIDETD